MNTWTLRHSNIWEPIRTRSLNDDSNLKPVFWRLRVIVDDLNVIKIIAFACMCSKSGNHIFVPVETLNTFLKQCKQNKRKKKKNPAIQTRVEDKKNEQLEWKMLKTKRRKKTTNECLKSMQRKSFHKHGVNYINNNLFQNETQQTQKYRILRWLHATAFCYFCIFTASAIIVKVFWCLYRWSFSQTGS